MIAPKMRNSLVYLPRQRIKDMRFTMNMKHLCSLALLLIASTARAGDIDAYFVDTLWPGDGEPIKNAVIIVEGGKIQSVGSATDVTIPPQAKRHNLNGRTVMPGIVAMETSIGIGSTDDERNVTPEYRAIDAFDFYGEYDQYLSSGVTSVHIAPANRRLLPGQSGMVKLGKGLPDTKRLKDTSGIKVVLSRSALNPPTVYEPPVGAVSVDRPLEPTRPQIGASYLEQVSGLAALLESSREADAVNDARLEALAFAIANKSPFRIVAETQSEVEAAIKLAKRFELNWMLVFPTSVVPFEDESMWKETDFVGVVLRPDASPGAVANPAIPTDENEAFSPSWKNAAKLIAMGLDSKVAIQPGSDDDLKDVMFLAKSFLRSGIKIEQVIRMMTANPAKMSGLEGKIGVLRAGADADFLVLTGEPLRDGTEILETYVNGKKEYQSVGESSGSLYSASAIYTPTGVVSNGMIAVANGKLIGVGKEVSIPTNADRKHFPNGVIVPGFIDVGSQLGLGSPLTAQVGLETKLGDLLAMDDESIQAARKGGLTTAFLSSTQLPSPVVAFKLGDKPRVLKDPVALRFALSGTVSAAESSIKRTLATAKQYTDSWTKYESEYADYERKKKEYDDAKKKYDEALKAAEAKKAEEAKKLEEAKKTDGGATQPTEKKEAPAPVTQLPASDSKPNGVTKPEDVGSSKQEKPSQEKPSEVAELKAPEMPKEPQKPRVLANLEPFRDLFAKKIVAMVEVKEDALFDVAIRVFKEEYGLALVIVGGDVASKMVETAHKHSIPIVVGPSLTKTVRDKTVNIPIELSLHSVPFLFQSNAAARAAGLADAVSYSVYKGLGRQVALSGLTDRASQIFQLGSVGSLEVGKDADFVVLSGSPLDLASEVLAVVIDGQIVYEKDSQ
ncbi:MAG: amidohydrolase family protein [Pirellula sp.]|nr:amidohydrolase family protein [Pirellula sp.]